MILDNTLVNKCNDNCLICNNSECLACKAGYSVNNYDKGICWKCNVSNCSSCIYGSEECNLCEDYFYYSAQCNNYK